MKLKLKLFVIEVDIEKELSHTSSYFGGLFLLVIGSLGLGTINTKTGRKSSENETQPFCNHFWSISSHVPC